jgi:hypothetical protein
MPKPAQPCDLKLDYAGALFWIEPHSPAGREWLQTIEHSQIGETCQAPDQRGRAVVPLRHLNEVLRMASRAKLQLAVPWDD